MRVKRRERAGAISEARRESLLGLEAARRDELAPFLVVRFDDAAHLTRTVGCRLEARSEQNPLRFRHRHDLGDLGIELGDTVLAAFRAARTGRAKRAR